MQIEPLGDGPAGGRFARNVMHFARALRAAGLPVGPGRVIDALKAVEALRREGAEPVAVAVIVDRSTGAQAAVEAEGLQWLAAVDLDDLGLAPQ